MSKIFNKLFSATERISYRRLTVFAASCALLLADKIDGDQWVMIAISYIAGQAAPAMAAAIKGK